MIDLITLDYHSRVPIYEQIIKEFERFIALGVLPPGEQIPSIRELASTIGANPNTVRKSYDRMEAMGIITTLSTKGTFVADNKDIAFNNKVNESINKIKDIIKELESLGVSKSEIMKKIK